MIDKKPIQQLAADYSAGADNAANTITYAAGAASQRHSISSVAASFVGGTPASILTIEDGAANIVWSVHLAAVGPHYFSFPDPMQFSPATALVVKLTAPGAGVTSKLSVGGHRVV